MTGLALLAGPPDRNSTISHLTLLVPDQAGVTPFHFTQHYKKHQLNDEADYKSGVYWSPNPKKVEKLALCLERLLPLRRSHVLYGPEPKPAHQTTKAFKIIAEGGKPDWPIGLNCVTALTNALLSVGITCPFMDLRTLKASMDFEKAVQAYPEAPEWQEVPQGLIWHRPQGRMDYATVTARLSRVTGP